MVPYKRKTAKKRLAAVVICSVEKGSTLSLSINKENWDLHQISGSNIAWLALSAIGDFGQELLEQFRNTLLYKFPLLSPDKRKSGW